MLKRSAALALAVAMLATPLNAYAVTWGDIISGIMTSSSQSFGDGTTSAKYEDGTLTVEGGSVDGVDLTIDKAGSAPMNPVNIIFKSVTLTGRTNTFNSVGSNYNVTLDDGSSVDGFVSIYAQDGGKIVLTNQGNVSGSVNGAAFGDGSVAQIVNEGDIDGSLRGSAYDTGAVDVTNRGTVKGTIGANAYDEGAANAANLGTAGRVNVSAWDESSAAAGNFGTLTGEYSAIVAGDDASAALVNKGEIEGSVFVDAYDQGNTAIVNDGTIASTEGASVDAYIRDDGTFSLTGTGIVKPGTYTDDDGNTTVYTTPVIAVRLPDDTDMSDPKAVEAAALKMAENLYVQNGQVFGNEKTMDVLIYDPNGMLYEDGVIELNLQPDPAVDDEIPEPTEEMIRHWMEQLRKEQAVGGVTGSPYLLKQMYMGYASHDLWLYDSAGEKVCFYERITSRDDNTKRLTLQVDGASTNSLTMRLSKDVIRMLRKLEFSVITLLAEDGTPYMEYSVDTLWTTVQFYKIKPWELLVVGGMNQPVMKVKADLTIVPVEE